MNILHQIKAILFEQEEPSEDQFSQGVIDAEEAIAQLFNDSNNELEHEDIQDFLDDDQNKDAADGEENLNTAWQNLIDFGLVQRNNNMWVWVAQDQEDLPMEESNLQEKRFNITFTTDDEQKIVFNLINKLFKQNKLEFSNFPDEIVVDPKDQKITLFIKKQIEKINKKRGKFSGIDIQESNLQEVPLRKINKIRGGKIVRKAFTAGKKGFRAVRKAGGKTARIVIQKGSEKLKRKLGAIKASKSRRAKKAIIKRKTAISKRKGQRAFGKSTRSFAA